MKWTHNKGSRVYTAEYRKEEGQEGINVHCHVFRFGPQNWRWTADAHCILHRGKYGRKIALHAIKAEGKGYTMKDAKTQAHQAAAFVWVAQDILRQTRGPALTRKVGKL